MGRPEQPPLEWGLHKEPMSPSTSIWHAGPEAGGEEDVVSVTPSIPTSHPAPALMSSDPASPPHLPPHMWEQELLLSLPGEGAGATAGGH